MMDHDDHDDFRAKPYSQMNQDSDMNMMEKFKMMMMMKEMMNNKHVDPTGSWSKFDNNERRNEEPSMYNFVKKMGYQNKNEDYMKLDPGVSLITTRDAMKSLQCTILSKRW